MATVSNPSISAIELPPHRDGRLDFWRALCLIDMVLVHLVFVGGVNFGVIQHAIGEYTRFAAGGFVFVAGVSIGAIFLPRMLKKGGRKKVYLSLWRRAAYILCVHFAATLSFVSLELIRGMRADVPSIPSMLRAILTFREGGDLLPLYVIMVAASPIMMELLRHRLGWLLGAASVTLFAWGQTHPWALSTPIHDSFPVVLWQMVFTAGMLFGAALPRYTKFPRSVKLGLALSAVAFSLLLWAGDFRSEFGWANPVLPFAFTKVPLSIGEALRYFGIIFTIIFSSDCVWHLISTSRIVGWINTLGRRSLAVYVAHVWVVGLISLFVWKTPWLGVWQSLLTIPAIGSLWLMARAMDWYDAREPKTAAKSKSRWLLIPLGISGGILALWICGFAIHIPPAIIPTKAAILPGWTDENLDPSESEPAPAFDGFDSSDNMAA